MLCARGARAASHAATPSRNVQSCGLQRLQRRRTRAGGVYCGSHAGGGARKLRRARPPIGRRGIPSTSLSEEEGGREDVGWEGRRPSKNALVVTIPPPSSK
jgi:hypothetical protein